ncbi:MAG: zinc ribbon domain-containing protein [Candidatus Hodarchaeales archaeon]
MFCPKCGKESEQSDVFCGYCGAKIARGASQTAHSGIAKYYALEAEVGDIKDLVAGLPAKESYLNRLKRTQEKKWKELQYVRSIMQKERKDYEELMKTSFASIKAKLSGNIDEKKKKEESEYLEALANFKDKERDYRQIESEVKELANSIIDIRKQKERIPAIEKEMSDILATLTEGKVTKSILALESQYDSLRNQFSDIQSIESEFKQADSLLSSAEGHLLAAKHSLQSASGLGTWDTFFGGGFFTDTAKHDRLDSARHSITQAQAFIRRAKDLVDGLDDIYIHFEAPSFLTDVFFDNFFVDLFGNSKISRTRDRVSKALYKLQDNRKSLQAYINNYEQQKMQKINEMNKIRRQIDQERVSLLE